MPFKDNLKRLRLRDKFTQAELAKKLGVSNSTISMYELGEREPNTEVLEALADVFNVDFNTLIGGDTTVTTTTNDDIKFALFKGSKEITDEMYQEVLDYAAYVEQKYLKDKK